MAAFGSASPKRTCLWGNTRALRHFLNRGLTKAEMEKKQTLVQKSISKDGRPQFTGKSAALKRSQLGTQLAFHVALECVDPT